MFQDFDYIDGHPHVRPFVSFWAPFFVAMATSAVECLSTARMIASHPLLVPGRVARSKHRRGLEHSTVMKRATAVVESQVMGGSHSLSSR